MAQDYAIRFLSSIPGSPLQAHFDDAEIRRIFRFSAANMLS
jgi:hypothetical protein